MKIPKLEFNRAPTPARENIFKRLNEIMAELNDLYEDGFFLYHEQNRNNEWQRLTDLVDAAIKKDSDGLCLNKLEYFRNSAVDLLKQYRVIKQRSDQLDINLPQEARR